MFRVKKLDQLVEGIAVCSLRVRCGRTGRCDDWGGWGGSISRGGRARSWKGGLAMQRRGLYYWYRSHSTDLGQLLHVVGVDLRRFGEGLKTVARS